jgi:hypothetical protein
MSTPANAMPNQAEIEKRSREWSQAEYARAMRHLLNQGYSEPGLMQPTSRILPPLVALWHFEAKLDGKRSRLWVVTGTDLPVDHVAETVAGNARDALRHFYLHWQLRAAQLEQKLANNQIEVGNPALQTDYMKSLQRGSERLFKLTNDDGLWPEFQKG